MSERDAIVTVTEADREAYSKMMVTWTDVSGPEHFARHRATHAAEVERLREALQVAAFRLEVAAENAKQRPHVYCIRIWAREARQALEASR